MLFFVQVQKMTVCTPYEIVCYKRHLNQAHYRTDQSLYGMNSKTELNY